MSEKKYIKPAEMAKILSISLNTLGRWDTFKRLPCLEVKGNGGRTTRRYCAEDVIASLEQREKMDNEPFPEMGIGYTVLSSVMKGYLHNHSRYNGNPLIVRNKKTPLIFVDHPILRRMEIGRAHV